MCVWIGGQVGVGICVAVGPVIVILVGVAEELKSHCASLCFS